MLINDRQITISAAGSRREKRWPAQVLYWSELVERLRIPVKGTETMAQYMAMNKGRQDAIKDVGGFVAGTLAGERRKGNAVLGRDVVTLDLDNIAAGQTNNVLCTVSALGCGYAVYSTRKHREEAPRLRVLLPLSRTVTADEYEPIARKIAEYIGLAMCDPTTFQAVRLMYWPNCCIDSTYVYTYADKPFLDADAMLKLYTDWRNCAEWPQVPGAAALVQRLSAKQADPLAKSGMVGAFCKVYNVYQALETFLSAEYTPTDTGDGRYSYTGGSTTGGAVVYDDGAFLYSHHATDPAGGRLVNSFDLVRLHRFAVLDDEAKEGTPTNKLPSYGAMCDYAIMDPQVAGILNQERIDKASADFDGVAIDDPTGENETINWSSKLALSSDSGLPLKTIYNVLLVLRHDPALKGKIAFDEFANRGLVLGPLPWDGRTKRREWTDVDDAAMRNYLEKTQSITGKERILDALAISAHENTINDVRDYLLGLSWDGVKRLDTLLMDYLGAADNEYVRAVTRKAFTAAVARVMQPGIKFDWVLILAGSQGIGKSTLLAKMGKRWYSDSLVSFEGTQATELIQGVWINELGELSSLSRSETNLAKQFISRTEDRYREPYGRRTACYPRRGVFFGTSNESEFLKDPTGERRFWPVTLMEQEPTKDVFEELGDEVNQLWAEAFMRWQIGERLHLPKEIEAMARTQQELYRESNAKEGIIREFIARPIPWDWGARSIVDRRIYWSGEFPRASGDVIPRDRVCAAEIFCECFGGDMKFLKRADAVEINNILMQLKGWKRCSSQARYGPYGQQRGFTRL